MKKMTTALLVAGCTLGLASLGFAQSPPQLNEISINQSSTDDVEFIEICGDPGTDLSAFWLIAIEGDAENAGRGLVDIAQNLTGLIGASGLYTVGADNVPCSDETLRSGGTNLIENGGNTYMLVRNFTGSTSTDVDADNDGVEDGPFPGLIVDKIAVGKPSSGDTPYYGAQMLGPDTGDGGTNDFDVAGIARCTDCTGDWGLMCFDGARGDQVCDTGNAFNDYNVTGATPCEANSCGVISVDESTWGEIKAQYR